MDGTAGAATFDDSTWAPLDADELPGAAPPPASQTWYRINVTIPATLGGFDPTGSTVVFEVVVRAAEVCDGRRARPPGTRTPASRAIVSAAGAARTAHPVRDPGHQSSELRAFTQGGEHPLGALDFFPPLREAGTGVGEVVRLRASLDTIIPLGARIDKVADRFRAVEGPVWMPEGYLLFSDFGANAIYRWSPDDGVSMFRPKSGYAGWTSNTLPGSNGLALDAEGRLTVTEHGRRRVIRVEESGAVTVLAERYDGRRLNSPNDLVYSPTALSISRTRPSGCPPVTPIHDGAGLQRHLRPGRRPAAAPERRPSRPNGLAFSPDERYLYVMNSDDARSAVMRYDVNADGTLARGHVFFTGAATG